MLFDAELGLGLEIVRYNIGGSNTTTNATNSMRAFAAVPSMLLANGTYNFTLVSSAPDVFVSLMCGYMSYMYTVYTLPALHVYSFHLPHTVTHYCTTPVDHK